MTTTNTTTAQVFEKITEIKNNYPELTFNNEGYQYLSNEVKGKYNEQIEGVKNLIKSVFPYITEFNNFKPKHDGTFSIRCQGYYDEVTYFQGVYYFNESNFLID